jgi:peptidoglycan/LPS O-acetylase OafA/YrhL
MSKYQDERYYELDSLRGLAAITVMFHHFVLVLPAFALPFGGDMPLMIRLLHYSPLGIFVAGRAAVIFFFVLSGFVLALPFLKPENSPTAGVFIIKRICRIYPPYLVALLVAVLLNLFCYRGGTVELSSWFNQFWQPQIDWKDVVQQAFLINSFNVDRFNPVIWSLVIEMRLSLLFPLLVFCAVRFGWKLNLFGGLLCCLVGWTAQFLKHRGVFHFQTNYFDTLNYVLMFVVGIQLALHREKLKQGFRQQRRLLKCLVFFLAVLAYTNGFWTAQLSRSPLVQQWIGTQITVDVLTTVAVACFIVMALASGKISAVLLWPPFHYLGKISYSFYLYHAVILVAVLQLFHAVMPLAWIFVLVSGLTFVLAALSYQWVETSSIQLGRLLTRAR